MTTLRSTPRFRPTTLAPTRRWAIALAAVCLLIPSLGSGQAAKDRPAGESKKLVLFDGKSLDGWKKADLPRSGEVKVENGQIIMKDGGSMTGVTTTRQDLPRVDYELSYEAMRIEGTDFFAAATFPVDKAYITLVNGGWGGNITGLSSLNGMDASENETSSTIKYEDKTWYRFRVRVTGKVIRCWVDDKEIIGVDYQDRRVSTRLETRPSEPLGFATWHTGGALRKIEIRTLTPAEVAAANKID
jgi:Domain of Unknown Function (DUF1080)